MSRNLKKGSEEASIEEERKAQRGEERGVAAGRLCFCM